MFADRVARYRPQGPDASGLLALQAAVFTGGDAVSAGLADAVVSPKQALAAFRDRFAAA
jgi:ClpP class serine protease